MTAPMAGSRCLTPVRSVGIHGDPVDIDFDHQGNVYMCLVLPRKQILVLNMDSEYLHCLGQSKHRDKERLCVCGDFVYATEGATHCVSVFHPSIA